MKLEEVESGTIFRLEGQEESYVRLNYWALCEAETTPEYYVVSLKDGKLYSFDPDLNVGVFSGRVL